MLIFKLFGTNIVVVNILIEACSYDEVIKMTRKEQPSYLPPGAELFQGVYTTIMYKLLRKGFTPWAPADVMRERNAAVGTPREEEMWGRYFNTSLAVGYTERDREVIFASEFDITAIPPLDLRDILPPHVLDKLTDQERKQIITENPVSLRDIVSPDNYKKIIRISYNDIGTLGNRLTEKEALEHKGWQILAGEDQNLLAKYVENVFRLGKDRQKKCNYHDPDKMMAFYIEGHKKAWPVVLSSSDCIGAAFTRFERPVFSYAAAMGNYGHNSYYFIDANIVGVHGASESKSSVAPDTLENTVRS